jgi:hypothetical protein
MTQRFNSKEDGTNNFSSGVRQNSNGRINPFQSHDSGIGGNPFVDKSDIARHKLKIQELTQRNKVKEGLY